MSTYYSNYIGHLPYSVVKEKQNPKKCLKHLMLAEWRINVFSRYSKTWSELGLDQPDLVI